MTVLGQGWWPLLEWAGLIGLAGAVVIVVGLAAAPDALLGDYPPSLQERYRDVHGGQSRRGRITDTVMGVILLVVTVGIGVLAIRDLGALTGGTIGFRGGFVLGVAAVVLLTVIDTVLVDWVVFCWWRPGFVVLPGTDDDPAYRDYAFHVKVLWPGFLLLVPAIGVGYGLLALVVEFAVSGP